MPRDLLILVLDSTLTAVTIVGSPDELFATFCSFRELALDGTIGT